MSEEAPGLDAWQLLATRMVQASEQAQFPSRCESFPCDAKTGLGGQKHTLQFEPVRVFKGEWLGLLVQGKLTEELQKPKVHGVSKEQDPQLPQVWQVLPFRGSRCL